MVIHIALCRGINVGGKNRVPMAELRLEFEGAGAREVETLIQSGNVIFDAPAKEARAICDAVAEAVDASLGVRAPLVLRTRSQFIRAAESHLLGDAEAAPRAFALGFLSRRPTATQAGALEHGRFAPDALAVKGSEVYLHYPNGAARSKLTVAYLDRVLQATTTVRNWATVRKVAAAALSR